MLCTTPEVLAILLSVEALEDNEIIAIQGARRFTKLIEPKPKWKLEKLNIPQQVMTHNRLKNVYVCKNNIFFVLRYRYVASIQKIIPFYQRVNSKKTIF